MKLGIGGFSIALLLFAGIASAENPSRIVSLNPSATETLFALDAGKSLIAVTHFCPVPELKKNKQSIGTVLEPDIERIIALKPDLVMATTEGNKKATIQTLKKAGIKVLVLGGIDNFSDLYDRIGLLGGVLGCENNASSLVAEIKARLNHIKAEERSEKKTVFMQLGTNPIVTINNDTIINEMIEFAGGSNIASNEPVRYPRYSREAVVAKDPDVIIIVSMGKFGERALSEWRRYKSLKAVQSNKIYLIDSELICHMGPRLVSGTEKIAQFLHSDNRNL